MNLSVYIFGNLYSGYTQYPLDYSSNIFDKFIQNATAVSQISVHRDGDLMYYGYTRKLNENQIIGFCAVINGVMLSNVSELFPFYEKLVESLAIEGKLIQFTNQGKLESKIDSLYTHHSMLEKLFDTIRVNFEDLNTNYEQLPPINFSKSIDSVRNFTDEDDNNEIVASCCTEGYNYIHKSTDYNTKKLTNFQGILYNLNKEKEKKEKEYNDLLNEHNKTLRQKKQYQRVALLFVCLLFAGLIILSLNSELAVTNENLNQTTEVLKDTQLRLTDSERMNSQQKEIIKENNKNIAVLKKQKQDLESQLDNAEDKIVQLNETITALDRTISSLKKQIPKYSNSNTFSYTSSNGNSDKIIKNPEIASKNSKSLTIKKIERKQNLTVIDFEYNNIYDASDWINIASDAYVVDSDTGKRYQMLEAYGIPKSPQKYTLKSVHETVNFSLVFPALPEKTRRINFIEYYNSSWNMYRIKLKD